ncbi:MAG: zinc-ribbon domain-containing protein [Anaerolineae bacterium]|jgi:hypothetical protein|nr:zinc-ribbon domain-containing protein [Anaerolineae bacterium]
MGAGESSILILIAGCAFALIAAAVVGGIAVLIIVLARRRQPTLRPGPPPKVCPACGAQNPPDYDFCERCGASL